MVEEVRRTHLLPDTDSEGDFMEKSVSELKDKLYGRMIFIRDVPDLNG